MMHLLKLSLLILPLFLFLSCEKKNEEPTVTACDESILDHLGLELFTGQIDEADCKSHLKKYRSSSGEELYAPDCNCCNTPPVIYNCEGDLLCNVFELCPLFNELTFIRIIGVEAE